MTREGQCFVLHSTDLEKGDSMHFHRDCALDAACASSYTAIVMDTAAGNTAVLKVLSSVLTAGWT